MGEDSFGGNGGVNEVAKGALQTLLQVLGEVRDGMEEGFSTSVYGNLSARTGCPMRGGGGTVLEWDAEGSIKDLWTLVKVTWSNSNGPLYSLKASKESDSSQERSRG